jgi:asparagine synthase (glutamine-hydrolysing)
MPRYGRCEQKVGVSLTGGLDTRIVMAYLDTPPNKYPCYTFGGPYTDSFDVKIARRVAEACRQTHQVITVDENFLSQFPQYAERTVYISDGGLDVGGAPELYINRQARQIAPIRLTGNYGSEVLRSVRFLKPALPREELFHSDFRPRLQNAVDTYGRIADGHSLSFTLFKDLPWHEYGRLAVEQSQLTPRSPFMDVDLVALMYRAVPEARMDRQMSRRLIATRSPALNAICTDRGIGGNRTYLIEPLRHLAYEFLFKAEYAYNYGMPQWLAAIDHSLAPLHLEKLFLGRHKFMHFRIWFRDQLAGYVKDALLNNRALARPYLNKRFVETMVQSHIQGTRNYTNEITTMLTAELIQTLLIEA